MAPRWMVYLCAVYGVARVNLRESGESKSQTPFPAKVKMPRAGQLRGSKGEFEWQQHEILSSDLQVRVDKAW